MDDPGVVAALVRGDAILLLDDHDTPPGERERPGRREPNDPRPDDRHVEPRHAGTLYHRRR